MERTRTLAFVVEALAVVLLVASAFAFNLFPPQQSYEKINYNLSINDPLAQVSVHDIDTFDNQGILCFWYPLNIEAIRGIEPEVGTNDYIRITDWVYTHIQYNDNLKANSSVLETLTTRTGVCLDRAVLNVSILRYYGYDAYVCEGTVLSNGAIVWHAWTMINIQGFYRILDQKAMENTSYLKSDQWYNEKVMVATKI